MIGSKQTGNNNSTKGENIIKIKKQHNIIPKQRPKQTESLG